MSLTAGGSRETPSKNGGLATYVELAFQAYRSPAGVGSARQRSSPSNTTAYVRRNSSGSIEVAMTFRISSIDGQMSASMTGRPSEPRPSGSSVRSMSTRPARANATTSGGEAR